MSLPFVEMTPGIALFHSSKVGQSTSVLSFRHPAGVVVVMVWACKVSEEKTVATGSKWESFIVDVNAADCGHRMMGGEGKFSSSAFTVIYISTK